MDIGSENNNTGFNIKNMNRENNNNDNHNNADISIDNDDNKNMDMNDEITVTTNIGMQNNMNSDNDVFDNNSDNDNNNNNNNTDNMNFDNNSDGNEIQFTTEQIKEALNGSIEELIKIKELMEQQIKIQQQALSNNQKYVEFHELAKKANIKDIPYRNNEILGGDAITLPDKYKVFIPALRRENAKAADIAEYLFPLLKIQYDILSRKNFIPFSDEFMDFFKLITVAVDKW